MTIPDKDLNLPATVQWISKVMDPKVGWGGVHVGGGSETPLSFFLFFFQERLESFRSFS